MKRFLVKSAVLKASIPIILALGMVACTGGQIPAPTQAPAKTAAPVQTPASGGPTTATPEAPEQPDTPALLWDASPDALVASATFCCGFSPEIVQTNYIPAGQIWGDGRVIWANLQPGGGRQLLEGKLTPEQLGALLEQAEQAGFFGWQELYTDPTSPTDLASKCLFLQVKDDARRVCEYYQGAPEAFHALFEQVSQGAGATGKDYVPSRGFLTAQPLPASTGAGKTEGVAVWDPAALDVSLAQAGEGVWVEGPALDKAWELVNANAWTPAAVEDSSVYYLTLQIPGVSIAPPPQG